MCGKRVSGTRIVFPSPTVIGALLMIHMIDEHWEIIERIHATTGNAAARHALNQNLMKAMNGGQATAEPWLAELEAEAAAELAGVGGQATELEPGIDALGELEARGPAELAELELYMTREDRPGTGRRRRPRGRATAPGAP